MVRSKSLIACTLLSTALATPSLWAADHPIARPVIPDRTFDITHFGAVGDGKTMNTKSIAAAITACKNANGGRVVIPAGRFLTGPVVLASNLELHLDAGSTLLMSNDTSVYRREKPGFNNLISASNCHDLAITGAGTIDGQGQPWWDAFLKIKNTPAQKDPQNHRPNLCAIGGCTRLLVEGVTFTNSPSFHLVPSQCTDVTIHNVSFKAPGRAPNTDALDPSGWHYDIRDCTFDVGDDCIAIKASGKPANGHLSCEDFRVTNCTFKHGHGLSIGGQTPGGLRDLVVKHCTFDGTDAGIRMKAARGSGGLVENLSYDDITMNNVKVPFYITSYYPKAPDDPAHDPAQAINDKTPIWRNIRISNVTVKNSPEAGRIIGLPEMPIQDILFTNVHISANKRLQVIHARDIRFENSSLTVANGKALVAEDANVSGLPAASAQ